MFLYEQCVILSLPYVQLSKRINEIYNSQKIIIQHLTGSHENKITQNKFYEYGTVLYLYVPERQTGLIGMKQRVAPQCDTVQCGDTAVRHF